MGTVNLILQLASYPEKDFIQMPSVAAFRAARAHPLGVGPAELQAPLAHRLIGNCYPTLIHYLFHVTEAEGKAEIQPTQWLMISEGK